MTSSYGKATFDVLAERNRQVCDEGYSTAHDDKLVGAQLAMGAAAYALSAAGEEETALEVWRKAGFKAEDFKSDDDVRRKMVKSASMAIAEIQRYDRLHK